MLFTIIFFVCVVFIIVLRIKFRRRVPILMYHRIATVPGERNSLPPDKFKEQLDYLQAHGFSTITLYDLYKHYIYQSPLPPKPVILTFDDGYEDNYWVALPFLKERHMKGTVFPIVNWVGKENKWENFMHKTTRTMDWGQLREWKSAGMEIGSHTLEHPFLTQCDEKRLEQELMDSKIALEENLDEKIDFLCYPYGFFDDKTIAIAQRSGYKGALAIFDNAPLWNLNIFAIARIPISAKQPIWEFSLKVSRFHIIFIMLRKVERNLKNFFKKTKARFC